MLISQMRPGHTRFLLALTLLGSLVFLGSCSNNRIGYNNMDWWARWHIRQHVSLDREQRHLVRDRINEVHQWHRETQLPRYADFLEEALMVLEDVPVSEEAMNELAQQTLALWRDLMERLVAPTAEVYSTLSDAQVRELLDNIGETQQERWLEGAEQDKEKQFEFYRERMLKNMNRWVGNATDEQKQWLEDWAETLHPLQVESADMLELWLAALAEALENRQDREALEASLRKLMLGPRNLYPEDYLQREAENQRSTLAMITHINNHLTEQQRDYRRQEFRRYIDDFRHLSR